MSLVDEPAAAQPSPHSLLDPPNQRHATWKDVAAAIRQSVRGLAGRRPT
jgi:hypothetical protein